MKLACLIGAGFPGFPFFHSKLIISFMIDVLRKSAVPLIVAAMTGTLVAKPEGWLEYKRDNWPVFSYPPGYSLNPRSFGGVDHRDEGTLSTRRR